MKKYLFVLSVLTIFSLLLVSSPVQAQSEGTDWLGFFFPSLKKEKYDPAETMTAPFAAPAEGEEKVENPEYKLPENAVPLNKPHRAEPLVGEWVMWVISESTTFISQNFEDDLRKTAPHFDQNGRQEYSNFLSQMGLLEILRSQKYYVRSFVEDRPLLINEGPVGGVYHWLYEIPIMISYMDRSVSTYKNNESVNKKILLNVQVGRSQDTANESGVVIEKISGKLRKGQKKKK